VKGGETVGEASLKKALAKPINLREGGTPGGHEKRPGTNTFNAVSGEVAGD